MPAGSRCRMVAPSPSCRSRGTQRRRIPPASGAPFIGVRSFTRWTIYGGALTSALTTYFRNKFAVACPSSTDEGRDGKMATKARVRWWRDGERLFVHLEGKRIEARWLKFEEQLVTLQCWPHCRGEFTQEPPQASVQPIEESKRDERSSPHEEDPLLDECLW